MQDQASLVYVMAVYIPDVQPLLWCHFQRPPGTPSPVMTRTNGFTWQRHNLRCCFSSLQPVTPSHTLSCDASRKVSLFLKWVKYLPLLPLGDIIDRVFLCLSVGLNSAYFVQLQHCFSKMNEKNASLLGTLPASMYSALIIIS